jgi:hypothetical protein
MDRFIQRLINQFLGKLMNRAISSGIDFAARRGKRPEDMTDAERKQASQGRDLAQKARKVQRAGRRLF